MSTLFLNIFHIICQFLFMQQVVLRYIKYSAAALILFPVTVNLRAEGRQVIADQDESKDSSKHDRIRFHDPFHKALKEPKLKY